MHFTTTDRDGARAYVYPQESLVLQRDGIPSWAWSAYDEDGAATATGPTRQSLLALMGIES